MMLMSMKSINQTSMRTCCKNCMHTKNGRKKQRRIAKRSERQKWMRNVHN